MLNCKVYFVDCSMIHFFFLLLGVLCNSASKLFFVDCRRFRFSLSIYREDSFCYIEMMFLEVIFLHAAGESCA